MTDEEAADLKMYREDASRERGRRVALEGEVKRLRMLLGHEEIEYSCHHSHLTGWLRSIDNGNAVFEDQHGNLHEKPVVFVRLVRP